MKGIVGIGFSEGDYGRAMLKTPDSFLEQVESLPLYFSMSHIYICSAPFFCSYCFLFHVSKYRKTDSGKLHVCGSLNFHGVHYGEGERHAVNPRSL